MRTNSYSDGIALCKEKNYSKAIQIFIEIIRNETDNHKAWNALGFAYTTTGQFENAKNAFEQALLLDPGNQVYEKNLTINILKWKKRKNSAKGKIPQIVPGEILTSHEKSLIKEYKIKGSQKPYRNKTIPNQNILSEEISKPISKYHEGLKAFNLNYTNTAIKLFKEHLADNPNDAKTWNAMGIVYAKEEYYIQSKKCFEKALEIKPDNSTFSKNLKSLNETLQDTNHSVKSNQSQKLKKRAACCKSPIYRIAYITIKLCIIFFLIAVIFSFYQTYSEKLYYSDEINHPNNCENITSVFSQYCDINLTNTESYNHSYLSQQISKTSNWTYVL